MTADLSGVKRMATVRELVGAEVLVVDHDAAVQRGMISLLSEADLNVTCATTPEDALGMLEKRFFSVAVVDLDTPTPGGGLRTTAAIKRRSPTTMVLILTPRKSFDDAVAAIRAGAIDVVLKTPEMVAYLKDRILEAASRSMDTREVRAVLKEIQEVHHDFLQLFMDAERRAMASEDRVAGRDPDRSVLISNLRVLVVDSDPRLAEALAASATPGYMFEQALSGGQALDLTGSHPYHYVMVSENLHDLPSSMVARSVKGQSPDAVVLAYSGPGPGGRVEVVETTQNRAVINDFTSPKQLIDRLDELAEAFRAKTRERRYTQAFREKYYDFLRRYVKIRDKVERALGVS